MKRPRSPARDVESSVDGGGMILSARQHMLCNEPRG